MSYNVTLHWWRTPRITYYVRTQNSEIVYLTLKLQRGGGSQFTKKINKYKYDWVVIATSNSSENDESSDDFNQKYHR